MTPAIAPTIRTRTTTTGTTVPTTPPLDDDPSSFLSFWLPPLVSSESRKIVEVKPFPDQYSIVDVSPWWPDGRQRLDNTTYSINHYPVDDSIDFRPAYPLSNRWKMDLGYYTRQWETSLRSKAQPEQILQIRLHFQVPFKNLMKCSQFKKCTKWGLEGHKLNFNGADYGSSSRQTDSLKGQNHDGD